MSMDTNQPEHVHCPHVAGLPFAMQPTGGPRILGQLSVCCHDGESFVAYLGILETGHGPHVTFATLPTIVPALEMPNGHHLLQRT